MLLSPSHLFKIPNPADRARIFKAPLSFRPLKRGRGNSYKIGIKLRAAPVRWANACAP